MSEKVCKELQVLLNDWQENIDDMDDNDRANQFIVGFAAGLKFVIKEIKDMARRPTEQGEEKR